MRQIRLRNMREYAVDIALRVIFTVTFIILEKRTPFTRVIQEEEMWLYKYPRTDSYVPVTILWPLVILTPTAVVGWYYWYRRDLQDLVQASLAASLGLSVNGVLTDIIKLIVGRPRPDYFWRCFPDGFLNAEMHCTGDEATIIDGRKSFPSGHSSFAFAGMTFVSLYLAGKLRVFTGRQSRPAWRLLVSMFPMVVSTCIALSRTCDYHHHWQDVLVGSLMGVAMATLSYRLYFPSLSSPLCHKSYASMSNQEIQGVTSCPASLLHEDVRSTSSRDDDGPREVKWI